MLKKTLSLVSIPMTMCSHEVNIISQLRSELNANSAAESLRLVYRNLMCTGKVFDESCDTSEQLRIWYWLLTRPQTSFLTQLIINIWTFSGPNASNWRGGSCVVKHYPFEGFEHMRWSIMDPEKIHVFEHKIEQQSFAYLRAYLRSKTYFIGSRAYLDSKIFTSLFHELVQLPIIN